MSNISHTTGIAQPAEGNEVQNLNLRSLTHKGCTYVALPSGPLCYQYKHGEKAQRLQKRKWETCRGFILPPPLSTTGYTTAGARSLRCKSSSPSLCRHLYSPTWLHAPTIFWMKDTGFGFVEEVLVGSLFGTRRLRWALRISSGELLLRILTVIMHCPVLVRLFLLSLVECDICMLGSKHVQEIVLIANQEVCWWSLRSLSQEHVSLLFGYLLFSVDLGCAVLWRWSFCALAPYVVFSRQCQKNPGIKRKTGSTGTPSAPLVPSWESSQMKADGKWWEMAELLSVKLLGHSSFQILFLAAVLDLAPFLIGVA